MRARVRALVVVMSWSLLALVGGAPTAAAGPGVATMSAGGYHTCAVRTNGSVWCWGLAESGQLGDGTTGDGDFVRTRPVRVLRGSSALSGVTKVAVGTAFSCAVRGNGSVWCWGDASQGQLGNGQTGPGAQRTKAVQVRRGSAGLTGVVHVAAGGAHACALRANGSVYCWGSAGYGQVGDGTRGEGMGHVRSTAVRVRRGSGSLDEVTAITAGDSHTCALRNDGSVWCWGDASYGQLGDGSMGDGQSRTKATRVRRGSGYLTTVSGIAAGAQHTCARRGDGTVWCWGYARVGQLGDGTTGSPTAQVRTRPVRVLRGSGVLSGATGIGAGAYHSCARGGNGSAWCWGNDSVGQLGDGTTGDSVTGARLKAVRVIRSSGSFAGVRKLAGGFFHTCALRMDATVWCWGANAYGQLGRGSHDDDPHPYPRTVEFP
jgi:alpha-tubulin suppressor-like RCC1 family protein